MAAPWSTATDPAALVIVQAVSVVQEACATTARVGLSI
jgi:hypothetical protein